MAVWSVSEGQHMDRHVKLNAPNYTRAWFSPDDSDDWYLIPSQYWHEGGSCKDEFGVSPRTKHPSYHAHFENMIHQDAVPFLTQLGECPFGSSSYAPQAPATIAPTATTDVGGDSEPEPTATATPAPTATPCIILRQGGSSPCSNHSSIQKARNGLFFPSYK